MYFIFRGRLHVYIHQSLSSDSSSLNHDQMQLSVNPLALLVLLLEFITICQAAAGWLKWRLAFIFLWLLISFSKSSLVLPVCAMNIIPVAHVNNDEQCILQNTQKLNKSRMGEKHYKICKIGQSVEWHMVSIFIGYSVCFMFIFFNEQWFRVSSYNCIKYTI